MSYKEPTAIFQCERYSLSLSDCDVSEPRDLKLNIKTIPEESKDKSMSPTGSYIMDRCGKVRYYVGPGISNINVTAMY
jgi:hypothetical protein